MCIVGRGIEREGLFFSLRRRLLNEGAVIYNSPDFQGRREKSMDEPCTTTSKGEEIKVEPDGISQHSSHASPSSQTLLPELGWLRQIRLFPCSARSLQRMKGTSFCLPGPDLPPCCAGWSTKNKLRMIVVIDSSLCIYSPKKQRLFFQPLNLVWACDLL